MISRFRMLFPVQVLPRGQQDHDERTLPKLHVSEWDVDVLPQRLSVHQAGREELHRGEEGGTVLPHHHVSARYVQVNVHTHCTVFRHVCYPTVPVELWSSTTLPPPLLEDGSISSSSSSSQGETGLAIPGPGCSIDGDAYTDGMQVSF
jgi:hypothetical protein